MRLLESQAGPERRGGGTMTSMVVHAALVAAAMAGTARSGSTARHGDFEWVVPVYKAPPADPTPPTTRSSGPARQEPGRSTGETVIPLPSTIRKGLPPVNVDVDVHVGTRTEVTIGGARSGTDAGGFGDGPAYGAPDASGAWDARTVEVAVVPDARNPSPSYPELLRTGGITGRVVAEFVVDSTGGVRAGSLAIVTSTHELFAMSVRRTVPSFRFTPARAQGRRVAQRVRVPFEFAIER